MHRFDFTMIGGEPLQAAESQKRLIVPDRPKTDVGRLQSSGVQGVGASRRRFRPRPGQMNIQ